MNSIEFKKYLFSWPDSNHFLLCILSTYILHRIKTKRYKECKKNNVSFLRVNNCTEY